MSPNRRIQPAISLLAFAAALLLSGCVASSGEPEQASNREKIADTAVVVCDKDGTRVLTPRVRALPDGVHFEVRNHLGADTGFNALGQEGGAGGDAPRGESGHVGDLSPGEARAGCEEPPYDGIGEVHYSAFEVVDPEGLFKSVELDCGEGMSVSGGPQYARSVRSAEGDLVGLVQRRFARDIEEGDVVEIAGYPELRGQRIVRVLRGDRVVATVHFLGERGDWLEDRYEACEGFT